MGIIATAEVECSTGGLSAWRWGHPLGQHNLSMLYYRWAVFTFLERWVFIDQDEWPFFKRCAITSFGHGLEFPVIGTHGLEFPVIGTHRGGRLPGHIRLMGEEGPSAKHLRFTKPRNVANLNGHSCDSPKLERSDSRARGRRESALVLLRRCTEPRTVQAVR